MGSRDDLVRNFGVRSSAGVSAALVFAILLVATAALAQTGGTGSSASAPASAGQTATQTFKSWSLDCLMPKSGAGAGKRVCFIHYEARDKANPGQIAARAVVRYSGNPRKPTLIVELPPNTVQTSGVSLVVDLGKPHAAAIQSCMPKFCYGAYDLTPDFEAEAKAGQQMMLSFAAKDKGAQQVPVPLYGITAALDALNKTGS